MHRVTFCLKSASFPLPGAAYCVLFTSFPLRVGILSVIYPKCDIVFLMYQLSRHGKAAKQSIEVSKLNKMWGGTTDAVVQMCNTIVKEVGEYNYNGCNKPQSQVNNVQKLTFQDTNKGPFYVKEPQQTEKSIQCQVGIKVLELLKEKFNFITKRHYFKE